MFARQPASEQAIAPPRTPVPPVITTVWPVKSVMFFSVNKSGSGRGLRALKTARSPVTIHRIICLICRLTSNRNRTTIILSNATIF